MTSISTVAELEERLSRPTMADISAMAELDGDLLTLEGLLLTPDGSAEIRARATGGIGDAQALGTELGGELRRRAGAGFGLDT